MITSDPLSVIETLPYLLDCDPTEHLLIAGLDADSRITESAVFPLAGNRPLDEALMEVTRWSDGANAVVAVAYSEQQHLDLTPLVLASTAARREPLQTLRAGRQRWRDFACAVPRCCPRIGNRYAVPAAGHPAFNPLPERLTDPAMWRTDRWDAWQQAIRAADAGPAIPSRELSLLSQSLFDIPLRDALLAQSARDDGALRPALRQLLTRMLERSTLGTALPTYTCAAAMAYLDGETIAALDAVNDVLAIDEYSLARLLRNGLEMRAPASLLARSFSHFDPIDLLAA